MHFWYSLSVTGTATKPWLVGNMLRKKTWKSMVKFVRKFESHGINIARVNSIASFELTQIASLILFGVGIHCDRAQSIYREVYASYKEREKDTPSGTICFHKWCGILKGYIFGWSLLCLQSGWLMGHRWCACLWSAIELNYNNYCWWPLMKKSRLGSELDNNQWSD